MSIALRPGGFHDTVDTDDLPHTYTYNGDGTLATDSVTDGTYTWVKTYLYTSGNMTSESVWVLQ